jgi:hypothetical protein
MSKSMRDQRDALFSTIMALLTASPLVSQLIKYHYAMIANKKDQVSGLSTYSFVNSGEVKVDFR